MSTAAPTKVTITTPGADGEVIHEDIPLPPRELWPTDEAAASELAIGAPVAKRNQSHPAAELAFVAGADRVRTVPLDWPFMMDGREVREITVRRLTGKEVGELVDRMTDFDLFEIYALQTGYPAAVLRGLDGDDTDKVTAVAYDFFPRSLKAGG